MCWWGNTFVFPHWGFLLNIRRFQNKKVATEKKNISRDDLKVK